MHCLPEIPFVPQATEIVTFQITNILTSIFKNDFVCFKSELNIFSYYKVHYQINV